MSIKIYWDIMQHSFYKYGSKVEYSEEGVYFSNSLLSPGATVVSWSSQIPYQLLRGMSQLPLLKRGAKYEIKFCGSPIPNDSVLIHIEFFSSSGTSVGSFFFENPSSHFYYPKEAYSYKISLIARGLKKLYFKHVSLKEVGSEY